MAHYLAAKSLLRAVGPFMLRPAGVAALVPTAARLVAFWQPAAAKSWAAPAVAGTWAPYSAQPQMDVQRHEVDAPEAPPTPRAAAPARGAGAGAEVPFHPRSQAPQVAGGKFADSYMLMHPVYTHEYAESITPTHRPPTQVRATRHQACVHRHVAVV